MMRILESIVRAGGHEAGHILRLKFGRGSHVRSMRSMRSMDATWAAWRRVETTATVPGQGRGLVGILMSAPGQRVSATTRRFSKLVMTPVIHLLRMVLAGRFGTSPPGSARPRESAAAKLWCKLGCLEKFSKPLSYSHSRKWRPAIFSALGRQKSRLP
jgi:hypothetical protein